MRRSIRGSRRAALLLAGTAATLLLASGCGAGQIAETAKKQSSVPGANVDLRTPGGFYKVRNLVVAYPGVEGYPAGGNAPIEVAIFNDTDKPVTVTVASDSARSVTLTSGTQATPGGAPTASAPAQSPAATASAPAQSPGASEQPGQPASSPSGQPAAGGPARIEIPARGFVTFTAGSGQQMQLTGLNQPLKAGQSVNLVFDFDGRKLTTRAPVMMPLTPAPVASPVVEGEGGHE